jgi:hypothetical protein
MGNLASKDEGNGDGAKLNTTSAGPSGPFTHSAGPARCLISGILLYAIYLLTLGRFAAVKG